MLTKNDSTWLDNSIVYEKPEWVKSPVRNNPVSQTKNTPVQLTTTVKVKPAGLHFTLYGADGSVDMFAKSDISSGADQEVDLDATWSMGNQVQVAKGAINWRVALTDPEPDYTINIGASGPHTVYLTYGTPSGSSPTETRVRFVCESAANQTALGDCANALYDHLSSKYNLGGPTWGPDPIWLLHDNDYISQCPGLADYVNKHFQMLGLGAGEINYCYAKPDGTYEASETDPGTATRQIIIGTGHHPANTTHDDDYGFECLAHIDGDGNTNAYEATCYFNSIHYALGVSRLQTTAKGVVNVAFPSIQWVYNIDTSEYQCTVEPWVEAP